MKAEMHESQLIYPTEVVEFTDKTLSVMVICEKDYSPKSNTKGRIILHKTIREAKKPVELIHKEIAVKISKVELQESGVVVNLTLELDKKDKDLTNFLETEKYIYVGWKKDLLVEHEIIKDANGKVVNESYYSNGLAMGRSMEYDPQDSTTVIYGNVLGQYHGSYELYFDDTLFKKMDYFMGQKSGKEIWYHTNGKIRYEGNSINGLKEGAAKNYYEDGSLHTEGNFENDSLEGMYIGYYQNGNKKESGLKHRGEYTGTCTAYYENGIIHFQQDKINGVNSGAYLRNYESGNLEVTASWLNNMLEGERTDYYDNGEMKMQGTYHEGKQIGTWFYWDEEGKKTVKSFD